ncbi:hypothetical protein [Bradyrhizobium japonicum]|nr:hypothetical protein [Bradyrhizobium japonicum]
MKSFVLVASLSLLLAAPATAHTPQQPPHQLFSEGDLKLESGVEVRPREAHSSQSTHLLPFKSLMAFIKPEAKYSFLH